MLNVSFDAMGPCHITHVVSKYWDDDVLNVSSRMVFIMLSDAMILDVAVSPSLGFPAHPIPSLWTTSIDDGVNLLYWLARICIDLAQGQISH